MTQSANTKSVKSVPEIKSGRTSAASREAKEECILVLQGGGALGAYQAGVFQGLSTVYREPTWVAGISIGAFNAALIAGNLPASRLGKLKNVFTISRDSAKL